jgi:AAA domain
MTRYDNIRGDILRLLRAGHEGAPGVDHALDELRAAYIDTVAAARDGGARAATAEFDRMVNGAGPQLAVPVVTGSSIDDRALCRLAGVDYDETVTRLATVTPIRRAASEQPATAAPARAWPGSVTGGSFIFDRPAGVTSLWGDGDDSLWSDGEAFMLAGGQGLGKTTIAGQLVRAQLGLVGRLLGFSVAPVAGKILYLAMDRPKQIARSLGRQFTPDERAIVEAKLIVLPGPPPIDLARDTDLLARVADENGADVVYVDSLKDAALRLSDDEVGAAYKRAWQRLLADGRNIAELHHIVKRGANGAEPSTVADIYGSTWLTSGAGSVILLTGAPGDPIVRFRHVKQPAREVGPFWLIHDEDAGTVEVHNKVNLYEMACAAGVDGLTAKGAACAMFDTDKPDRGQIEKAHRKLDRLAADGALTLVEGDKGGAGDTRKPSAYFAA